MSRQITTRIVGGLGNQLFVWAASLGVAARCGGQLRLDTRSGFQRDPFGRQYELGRLCVEAAEAPDWACFQHPGGRIRRALMRRISASLPVARRPYLQEPPGGFGRALLDYRPTGSVYLEGLWQSALYFSDCADEVRRQCRLRMPTAALSAAIQKVASLQNPVAVHFRSYHELKAGTSGNKLGAAYYDAARTRIRELCGEVTWLVFSDDLAWARSAWPKGEASVLFADELMAGGKVDSVEELFLMASARHFIIANSTYSWWGAWIGSAKGGCVVAPDFRTVCADVTLVPPSWHKLPTTG